MSAGEDRSAADRKKVRFPPPKAWDPEAKKTQETQECVLFQECGEKHSPVRCEVFKKMTPQQRLKKIDERELCRLFYHHLQGRDCWPQGRVPNCGVDGCETPQNPLVHAAVSWSCRGPARRRCRPKRIRYRKSTDLCLPKY
jgi:hypothetical protein